VSPDVLIVIGGLAAAISVVSTVYSFLRKEPSARVTVQTDGGSKAFQISREDAARLKVILEREAQSFREQRLSKPRTDRVSFSS
jgi:hypothetical protein